MKKLEVRLIGLFATFLTGTVSTHSSAQVMVRPDELPDFVTVINGRDTPELIDDDQVYTAVANMLVRYGPESCANSGSIDASATGDPGFMQRSGCLTIPGVNMMEIEQLSKEFLTYSRQIDGALPSDFCGTEANRLTQMNRAEYAKEFDSATKELSQLKADFFEVRGNELMGEPGFEELLKWADQTVRPGMIQPQVNTERMMEETGLTPAKMVEQICTSGPAR